jgi:DNA-binding NarL/FixJ family response regulator
MSYGVVYGLYDPRTDALRYIGQTTKTLKQRLWGHVCGHNLARSLYSARWLAQLRQLGLDPHIWPLAEAGSRKELNVLEMKFIAEARLRGERLTNITDGGEGHSTPHSVETRAKIAAAHKGRPKSVETRAKLSVKAKGRKLSEEAKRKLSLAFTGKIISEETKVKLRGQKRTEETKCKIRAKQLGHLVSQATRDKIANTKRGVPSGRKGVKQSPEALLKNRLSHLGLRPTPEARARLSASLTGLMVGPNHPQYLHTLDTNLILRRLRDGLSRKEVAKELGINVRLISRRLMQAERAGLATPKSTLGKLIPTSTIRQKLAEGKTKIQIARELGVSKAFVYLRLRQEVA